MLQTFASALTTLGLAIALAGLRQAQRQRLRQFEALYVKRFWDLSDRFSLAVLRGEPGSVDEDDERAIRAYLRLCEDELELRREGWISDATWSVWSSGIESHLRRPPFAEVWTDVRGQSEESGDFSALKDFVAGGFADPRKVGRHVARLRGLNGGPG